jgi:hypothetical protein
MWCKSTTSIPGLDIALDITNPATQYVALQSRLSGQEYKNAHNWRFLWD